MSQKLLEARWRMNGPSLGRRAVDPGQLSVAVGWAGLIFGINIRYLRNGESKYDRR